MKRFGLMLMVALRNLSRQKRRNILLGITIAFGIMILTVANSFSKGITDNLLNKIVVYVSGHVQVTMVEKGKMMAPIIRDRDEILGLITRNIEGIADIQESIGAMGRGVGNGQGDYIYIVGLKPSDVDDEFKAFYKIKDGSFDNYTNPGASNPLILSESKAEKLNVKVGDTVRIRVENINGQAQTGLLNVAVIVKSQNMFMDFAIYTPIDTLKKILGYQPWETGSLQIILKNPRTAIEKADQLHRMIQSYPAAIQANTFGGNITLMTSVKNISANIWTAVFPVIPEDKDVIISSRLAKHMKLKIGSHFNAVFDTMFAGPQTIPLKVTHIVDYPEGISVRLIILGQKQFYTYYNQYKPATKVDLSPLLNLDTDHQYEHPFWSQIGRNFSLLSRTRSTDDYRKKFRDVSLEKDIQPMVDVSSMYETSSQIVQMESVFNLVTLIAASVLFFIIMIGVLNSLRMTVRERTREIGTMRAIGMKRKEVLVSFVLETICLVVISWVIGTLLGLLLMKGLTLIQFTQDNALNMLMVDRRLYFVTTPGNLLNNLILILVFGIVTAFMPAKRAAKLKPADALRFTN